MENEKKKHVVCIAIVEERIRFEKIKYEKSAKDVTAETLILLESIQAHMYDRVTVPHEGDFISYAEAIARVNFMQEKISKLREEIAYDEVFSRPNLIRTQKDLENLIMKEHKLLADIVAATLVGLEISDEVATKIELTS